jgi:hypothetical protein
MERHEEAVFELIVIAEVITIGFADYSIELLIVVRLDFKANVILLRVRHYYCWVIKNCRYYGILSLLPSVFFFKHSLFFLLNVFFIGYRPCYLT